MIQFNARALELASSPPREPPVRPRPRIAAPGATPQDCSTPRGQAGSPLQGGPHGSLRVQLTFAFAAAMTLCCALFVAAAFAFSTASGLTLLTSIGVAACLLVAATLAGWVILGRALRPLAQLAACADELDGRWVRTSVNITGDQVEVHRARGALDRALTRLRDCHAALDLFVSNVAHELQDPVTTVLAEAQGMTAGEQSVEALSGFARSARCEVGRIGKIIAGSLTLARLESAQRPGDLTPFCMLDVALDVVKHAHPRAKERDVRLVLMLPESEDVQVRGDAELVTSMLENVVNNAVRHSPSGEEIRIHLERTGERLRIAVRDHGPGVPPELLPHVLEAHVHGAHVHGSRESCGAHGRGLGLAIAARVARYHDGSIHIGNHLDGGCEVVMSLPLDRLRAVPQSRGRSSRSLVSA